MYKRQPLDEADGLRGGKIALLIGNEGNGLSDEAVGAADLAVRIPMAQGVESVSYTHLDVYKRQHLHH